MSKETQTTDAEAGVQQTESSGSNPSIDEEDDAEPTPTSEDETQTSPGASADSPIGGSGGQAPSVSMGMEQMGVNVNGTSDDSLEDVTDAAEDLIEKMASEYTKIEDGGHNDPMCQ